MIVIYFTGQPASPFEIDPDTGSVYLTKDLTRAEYRDKSSFTLNVSATDDGSCCTPGEIYTYSPMIHGEYFSRHRLNDSACSRVSLILHKLFTNVIVTLVNITNVNIY